LAADIYSNIIEKQKKCVYRLGQRQSATGQRGDLKTSLRLKERQKILCGHGDREREREGEKERERERAREREREGGRGGGGGEISSEFM